MAEWADTMLADMTIEEAPGKNVFVKDLAFVKEAPDLQTFVKGAIDAHKEVGARVRIPGKDAKPEDLTAFRGKLIENGILSAPVKDIRDYGIVKPEKLADGVGWSDDLATKFGTVLQKHGVAREAAKDLLDLYQEGLLGTQKQLETSFEAGMSELKKEWGADFDKMQESTKRLTSHIFKTPEELDFFEATGLANHPTFLKVMMRLSKYAENDSTFVKEQGREQGGSMTADEVRAEMGRIMSDKTHPLNEGYLRRDPATLAKVEEMYKKAFGDGKVEL